MVWEVKRRTKRTGGKIVWGGGSSQAESSSGSFESILFCRWALGHNGTSSPQLDFRSASIFSIFAPESASASCGESNPILVFVATYHWTIFTLIISRVQRESARSVENAVLCSSALFFRLTSLHKGTSVSPTSVHASTNENDTSLPLKILQTRKKNPQPIK